MLRPLERRVGQVTQLGTNSLGFPPFPRAAHAGLALADQGTPLLHIRAGQATQANSTLASGSVMAFGLRDVVTGSTFLTTSGFNTQTTPNSVQWLRNVGVCGLNVGSFGDIEAVFFSTMRGGEVNNAAGGAVILGFNSNSVSLLSGNAVAGLTGESMTLNLGGGKAIAYANTSSQQQVRSTPYVIGCVWNGLAYDLYVNGVQWQVLTSDVTTVPRIAANSVFLFNRPGLGLTSTLLAWHELAIYKFARSINPMQIMERMARNCGGAFINTARRVAFTSAWSLSVGNGVTVGVDVASVTGCFSPFYGVLGAAGSGTNSFGTDGKIYYTGGAADSAFACAFTDRATGDAFTLNINAKNT